MGPVEIPFGYVLVFCQLHLRVPLESKERVDWCRRMIELRQVILRLLDVPDETRLFLQSSSPEAFASYLIGRAMINPSMAVTLAETLIRITRDKSPAWISE